MTEKWTRDEIENQRLLKSSSICKNTEGYIKLNKHNTYEHELKKFNMAWQTLKEGDKFYTEAEFKDNQCRADLFNISKGVIVEILLSETIEEFEKKKSYYPKELTICAVKCDKEERK